MEELLSEWKQLYEQLRRTVALESSELLAQSVAAMERLIALLSAPTNKPFTAIRQEVREIQRLVSAQRSMSLRSDAALDVLTEHVLELCVQTLNRVQSADGTPVKDADHAPKLLFQADVSRSGAGRMLRIFSGDLTETGEAYDIVACSAFRGDYIPLRSTLIGALFSKRQISVGQLSASPALDFRAMGCWLSQDTGKALRRIACLELLDYRKFLHSDDVDTVMLKSAFATLRFLLEQAAIHDIPVRSVALPVLGAGAQGIDLNYIVAPLVSQCMSAFDTIPSLECIDFYEFNASRAQALTAMVKSVVARQEDTLPQVFISYSSKQTGLAHKLSDLVNSCGFPTWIAPESINAGSNYQEEIPMAINDVRMMLLLLSQDAQRSKWVQKEVGSAIGAGKILLPLQLEPFSINAQFRFLLEGEQIFPAWQYGEQELPGLVAQEVRFKLN